MSVDGDLPKTCACPRGFAPSPGSPWPQLICLVETRLPGQSTRYGMQKPPPLEQSVTMPPNQHGLLHLDDQRAPGTPNEVHILK